MTNMIEKMARAIQRSDLSNDRNEYVIETDWEINGHKYTRQAKAALSALEDPSEEMIVAIWPFVCTGDADESYQRNDPVIRAYAKDCIAAALQSAKREAET